MSDLLNTQAGILSLRLHIPAVSCGWVLAKKPALQNRAGRTKNLKFGCYGAEALLSKNSGLFVSLCSSAVQPQPGSTTSTGAASGHRRCTVLCILIPCPELAAVWGWWSHILSKLGELVLPERGIKAEVWPILPYTYSWNNFLLVSSVSFCRCMVLSFHFTQIHCVHFFVFLGEILHCLSLSSSRGTREV